MKIDEADFQGHSRKLNTPISIGQLLNGTGQCFDFGPAEEELEPESFDNQFEFGATELEKFTKLDLLNVEDGDMSPLERFKQFMSNVPYGPNNCVDGKLMKKIKQVGCGDCPPPGAFVHIHYMYYSEFNEVPIDITYLRNSTPEKFQIGGNSGLIPAVEYAIFSMKKGEKADFYAHYNLCFKELGCSPRIPPKSDLLFEIDLINFTVIADSVPLLSGVEDELEVKSGEAPKFKVIIKNAESLGARANGLFKEKNLTGAIRNYRRALNTLFNYRMENDEEQREVESLLCKMYKNLMVCYNQKGQFERVCGYAARAHQYATRFATKDAKLYYNWGKALSGLKNWKLALEKFNRAAKLTTKDSDAQLIYKEMVKANKAATKYEKTEKLMCANMFKFNSSDPQADVMTEESSRLAIQEITNESPDEPEELANLRDVLIIELGEFKMKDGIYERDLGYANEFGPEEIDVIKDVAKRVGLQCKVAGKIVVHKVI